MSFLRLARHPHHLRPFVRRPARLTFANQRFAGDYGSGEGDPKGEKPQEQGKNPMSHLEHPGPPPPSAGQEKSGDGAEKQPSGEKQSTSSSSSSSKGTQGAQPKILNESPPKDGNESDDVAQHNQDFDSRAEKAHEKVSNNDVEGDKVGKGFWSGHGGADRQP